MKSPNLLIDANWRVKISDFGFSTIKKAASNMTRVGSPVWAAPEVMRGEPYTEKLDIYSFAIVMWELLNRDEPYKGIYFPYQPYHIDLNITFLSQMCGPRAYVLEV
jgi:serine/threonine protein kinase